MSSFVNKREAALSIAPLPQASGSAAPGRWARAWASWTKRWVRRRSPRSASANSVTAQLVASRRSHMSASLRNGLHRKSKWRIHAHHSSSPSKTKNVSNWQVFEVGGRATHLGDEAVEQGGNRVARPGLRYRDADTVDPVQREGARYELMVMGVSGQHSQNLACAQANTDIDQPDQAVAQGGLAQRQALQQAGRLGADHRKARHPIDHGLRTRGFLDAQRPSEETQDA